MKPEILYALISLAIFTLYVGGVWIKYGVRKSISDSYYFIKHKPLFTLALWGFSIFAIFSLPNIWMMLACAGIGFVGAAPDFRIKMQGDVHYIAAVSGIFFGAIALWSIGYWYLTALMAIGILILEFYAKNKTWWQEVLAFYMILFVAILKSIL